MWNFFCTFAPKFVVRIGAAGKYMTLEEKKLIAWNNANEVEGVDKTIFRKDACGAWIRWDKYGNQQSDMGWEIDHVYPLSLGGTDEPENLRALHYQNNASKGDDYPMYEAVVSAEGEHNQPNRRYISVNDRRRQLLKQYYPNA